MNAIRTLLALTAVAALSGCSPPAVEKKAAATPALTGEDAAHVETGKTISELMTPSFTPEQQGRIINMGYYMAASSLCPTLEVDGQKMGRAVQVVLDMDAAGATAQQKQHQHDALLMFLGMASGSMMAAQVSHKDAFCAEATKLKDGPANEHLFTGGTPSAPSTAPVPEIAPTEPAAAPKG